MSEQRLSLEPERIERVDDVRMRDLIDAADTYYAARYPPQSIHTSPPETLIGGRFAARIMQQLERFALDSGVFTIRRETGVRQPEAARMYRRLGYLERGPCGNDRSDPLSICMEKSLTVTGDQR